MKLLEGETWMNLVIVAILLALTIASLPLIWFEVLFEKRVEPCKPLPPLAGWPRV